MKKIMSNLVNISGGNFAVIVAAGVVGNAVYDEAQHAYGQYKEAYDAYAVAAAAEAQAAAYQAKIDAMNRD